MTWRFFYFAFLILGLSLAAVFGILESLARHKDVALPRAEMLRHRRQMHICHLGVALAVFGALGLVLGWPVRWRWHTVLLLAVSGAFVSWVVARWLLRLPCPPSVLGQEAVVLRDIPPGGYGQVRITYGCEQTVMAAQNEGPEPIPAGSPVQVVDCRSSVIVVRRLRAS